MDKSDFPLVHSHWCIDTHTEYDDDFEVISKRRFDLIEILKNNPNSVFANIEELKNDYRKTIIWRIGNTNYKYEELMDEIKTVLKQQ